MEARATELPALPLVLRQRVLLFAALLSAVGAAWGYLAWMSAEVAAPGGASLAHCAAMPGMTSSSAAYVAWLFGMWAVMAVAMMLPTAIPVLGLYFRFHHARHPGVRATRPTLGLATGYLLGWFAFGAAAALLQWGLEHAGLLEPVLGRARTPLVGGVVAIGAGLFQLSPLKEACLTKCRTPLGFLMTRWKEGTRGAVAMGLEHGLHCVGCCWALMLVMFVAGVMNLTWMALLGVVMLLEKVAPHGDIVARGVGFTLVFAGAFLIFG